LRIGPEIVGQPGAELLFDGRMIGGVGGKGKKRKKEDRGK
jgi:hypothetical protein